MIIQTNLILVYCFYCLGDNTFCGVADKEDINIKALIIKNERKLDVVRPNWILRCLAADRLLPFRPEDLMVFHLVRNIFSINIFHRIF